MTIEKLTIKREQLLNQKVAANKRYTRKISRIDKAIRKFVERMAVLNERKSATSEIENILSNGQELHVSKITEILSERGFATAQQSVSAILQSYHKKFKRVAPATFALVTESEKAASA